MSKTRMSRESLLPLLADHVLANGISSASLRPMAKAAGTSDRMLIYHFGNKQGVIDGVLEHLAAQFQAGLDSALKGDPAKDRRETVQRILRITSQPELAPYLRLWWEIVAESAKGNAVFRATAAQTIRTLLGWLEHNMPDGDPDPEGGSRILLTIIEGAQMLGAIGCQDIAEDGLEAF